VIRRWRRPKAPVNVRVVQYGETIPIELSYVGVDRDDLHCWAATMAVPLDPTGAFEVLADELPPRTRIVLRRAMPLEDT
jgi:hypothetical protein